MIMIIIIIIIIIKEDDKIANANDLFKEKEMTGPYRINRK